MSQAEREPRTCKLCNVSSSWQDGFVQRANGFGGKYDACITCHFYRQKYRDFYLSWVFWSAAVLAGGYHLSGDPGDAVLLAVALYAVLYSSLVIHELGHYAAAKAVGVRVAAISFGGGLRSKAVRLRRMFLLLSFTPSEGLIITTFDTREHYRKKYALIVAAGPLVNAAATVAGAVALTTAALSERVEVVLTMWTSVNALLAIGNLWFFEHRTAYGNQKSDGLQLFTLHKMTDDEIDEVVTATNTVHAYLHYRYGTMKDALAILEDEIGNPAAPFATRALATALLVENGQLDRAAAFTRNYLKDDDLAPMEKALLRNNLAFTLSMMGDDALVDEAFELAGQAFAEVPMLLAVRSTYGSLLIAKGRYEEGVALLTDKRFKLETPAHQATVSARRAFGLAKLGELALARKAYEFAREQDPDNRHLSQVEPLLAAAA